MRPTAIDLLHHHLGRRPDAHPIQQFRVDFPRHMDRLIQQPASFHDFAFSTFRQLGANFHLLGQHLDWLRVGGLQGLDEAQTAAEASPAARGYLVTDE